jgi:hypothetical protein
LDAQAELFIVRVYRFLPGYPSKQESVFWESDFKDRNVIEAPFNMKIGKFDAWDYLGDGSLYILNVPGHAVGHVCDIRACVSGLWRC